ncbi:phage filamentation protein Fil family protein [Gibbsiella quercinecans]|uniref:phage filamentation protein Fil family protein n=1 Tax=Gibbsiella quercinecans TaxID=929813 RepID=UPI00242A4521|nr:phage filamentation protein Fil family protein [Gibbsiella quercinecans]
MKVFAHFLKQQSPSPQLPSYGHGWIELPNGQRWQPCASRVVFSGDSVAPGKRAKRRPWWFRLMGLRG